MEFRHKDQLIGFVATHELVIINEVACKALVTFNLYERSERFIAQLIKNQETFHDEQQFVDWLRQERYVEVASKKDIPRKKVLRRYKNYPLTPDSQRVFWIVGTLSKYFTEKELAQLTPVDIYILSVIHDHNGELDKYLSVPIGALICTSMKEIKSRIRRCAVLLRELEYQWRRTGKRLNPEE